MKFAYTRRGGPLLNWSGPTPPYQSRAGETRSLGDFNATTRNSVALRRYGGTRDWPGGAKGYEHNRALGDLDVPRPGAPEIVSGYESPEPGAATIHLGGYMPEGAARNYGNTFLADDAAPTTSVMSAVSNPLVKKASVLAAAYHGVRRNNGSVLWGLLWAVGAYLAPINGLSAVALAAAQGFGQPKFTNNPARRRKRGKRARVGNKAWRRRFQAAARRLDARRRKRKAKPYKAKGF